MELNNYTAQKIISPLKISLPYLFVGLMYILTSDYILSILIHQNDLLLRFQSLKGVGFIVITTILLYFLVKRHSDLLIDFYEKLIGRISHSEQRARVSEEKYMNLFEFGPLPMWIFDKESLAFKLVNQAAVNVYGYTKEEFYQMTIKDIRPGSDLNLLHKVLDNHINESHKVLPNTFRHITKSGKIIYVKIERVAVQYDEKESVLVIVSDLTESIENQRKLYQSYQRLYSSSKIARIGYWSINVKSKRIHCSKILKEIIQVNISSENLNWKILLNRVYSEDLHLLLNQLKKLEVSDQNVDFEHRVVTLDNTIKWVKHTIKINREKDGTLLGFEGILVDINQRKQAEEDALKNQERFNMLSKTVFEAVVDWDLVNQKVYLSKGFKDLFGYENSMDIVNFWSNNIYSEDKSRVLNHLRNVMADTGKSEFFDEYRFVKSNGELAYVQHKGIFERDKSGKVTRAVGAINDMTESIDRIRKINSQNEKLSKIMWTQSHIVRSPLVSVMGLVDILKQKEHFEKKDVENILEMLYSSAEKLDMAIHDLTDDVNKDLVVND